GFNPKNVLYARLSLPKSYDNDRVKQNALTRRLLERMKALPGVTAVSESILLPPLTYDWSETIIPGKPHAERWETRYEICSDGFFETLGLKLQRGRSFSGEDVDAKRFVMVVNQKFAQQYFANEEPIDRKSTRLNSSHLGISYAVFCLKKKNNSSRSDFHAERPYSMSN